MLLSGAEVVDTGASAAAPVSLVWPLVAMPAGGQLCYTP